MPYFLRGAGASSALDGMAQEFNLLVVMFFKSDDGVTILHWNALNMGLGLSLFKRFHPPHIQLWMGSYPG